jgi:hypothetical protein
VYCNLDNVYFKSGNLPQAILQYGRALNLSLTDHKIVYNLQLAGQQHALHCPLAQTFTIQHYGFVRLSGIGTDTSALDGRKNIKQKGEKGCY